MRRWAADKRRRSRRCVCVCASIRGIRTCLDEQGSIQTHVAQRSIPHPRARTRTRNRSSRHGFYICTHTYTYVLTHTHIYVHVSWPRRALTRTYAQTCMLHMLSYIYIRAQTYPHIYVHSDTQLEVATSGCAAAHAARTNTRT
jgi:hypothetical protein